MKWDFRHELARKFVHLLSIFILLVYFRISDFFERDTAMLLLVLILIIFLEFEYLRIETGRKIPILNNIWNFVRRNKEKGKLGGDVFFLIGAILVLSIFNIRIAVTAILMTTFGDMAAALVGKKYGAHKIPYFKNKSWEGSLSGFFVNIIIAVIVFSWGNPDIVYSSAVWILILVMSLTASFVEAVVRKLDDNLLIPVFAGFNGQLIYRLLSPF